jgi:hypothetical protein
MWTVIKDNIAKQHIKLRDELRNQFEREQGSKADLLYESAKLIKPITESTEKIQKTLLRQPIPPQQRIKEEPPLEAAAPPEYAVIDADYGLDIEVLEEMGFDRPSRIKDPNTYDDIIEKVNHYNKYFLGRAKRGSVSEDRDLLTEKININKEYVKRLRLLMGGQKLLVGRSLKMVGNKFGSLSIDKKQLESGRLKATKDGKTVMNEVVDRSLYKLLTKRFCKSNKYSKLAVDTFKKLMELADIPLHTRTKDCPKREVISGEAIHYSDPNDLVSRLQLLVAGKQAGNTGLNNDISGIIDELLSKSYITKEVAIKLYNNLLDEIKI